LSTISYLEFVTMSFDVNLTRRRRRRGFTNSQITRRYNSARIYGRRVSGYSGCTRATIQTWGENGGTNVRELTMYGVCALSETQIAMRMQRQPDEIRSTCERVKLVRVIHVCCPSTHVRRYTINEIATGDAWNLIGYWYFYLYDIECTAQKQWLHEKCSILSIFYTSTSIVLVCDNRADHISATAN